MRIYVDSTVYDYGESPTYYQLAKDTAGPGKAAVMLAKVNGRLRELRNRASDGEQVQFIYETDQAGYVTYHRSALMLCQTALHNLGFGGPGGAIVHFSIGSGLYLTLKDGRKADQALADALYAEMRRLSELGLPFEKMSIPTSEAIDLFTKNGMPDKAKLFRTRTSSWVNIYKLDGYVDYYFGFLAHDTASIQDYSVTPYHDGLYLNLPEPIRPGEPSRFSISEKLFDAEIQGEIWAKQLGIGTVGDLNEKIIQEGVSDVVLTCEAMQESKISDIAEQITLRSSVRFVMIAGPSSSGKTTFSQRLSIQLVAHGLKPHYIGVDNYFVDRDKMPVGSDGRKDFESLSGVDVELFNSDMNALLRGERVQLPSFDFVQGRRVYHGNSLKLDADSILVIEGIHCLNGKLSYALPEESKFRIYISALTQLNVDDHNRIASSDGRLIRRIIRDNRTRGYTASMTIAMWDQVRRGEVMNIFPFQDSADVVFNSALPYEIAALKVYAQPLLFQITPDDPAYQEAKRLLKFLDFFVAIPSEGVPKTSLLREFIGGGCFHM